MKHILLYDIEIAPMLGWAYDMWDTNIIRVENEPFILCFAYQWWGTGETKVVALPDFDGYVRGDDYDFSVVQELHKLLDKADIVVAHNADRFDNRVANTRFIQWGLTPPSPYRSIDTLKAARKYFKFGNNSLASLSERLLCESKTSVTHSQLWYDCVNGNMGAWKKLKKYCKRDVTLLTDLYEQLLPYISNHPNIAEGFACPKCGSYLGMQSRGFARTSTAEYRRYQCKNCGGWSRSRLMDKEAERPDLVGL